MKISLRRCHAQIVGDGAFSHKIDRVRKFFKIQNLEGHQNCRISLKVAVILLNGGVLLFAGVALQRVCACSLRSRLVLKQHKIGLNGLNGLNIM